MEKWARINYHPNLPLYPREYVTASDAHIRLSLHAAEEGMVLLKNENSLLPLTPGSRICLFGKGIFDYVKGGGGSGDVYTSYLRNLYDGLMHNGDAQLFAPLTDFYRDQVAQQYAEGIVPGMVREPILPADLLEQAAAYSDTAVLVFSRFSGEGWDRSASVHEIEQNPFLNENTLLNRMHEIFPEGDFYLSPEEKALVAQVTARFPKVVAVLNVGGMVDTGWIKNDPSIGAALLAWQGGMEGGLAAANLLFGRANPSGKLPDTFCAHLEDYPSTEGFHESVDYVNYTEDIFVGYRYFETMDGAKLKVCYPFGYGLSYTTFAIDDLGGSLEDGQITLRFRVTNTGSIAGKEVVQVYCNAPQGKLGKARLSLAGFTKTPLLQPGEQQEVTVCFARDALASFDDIGSVCRSAYVLEHGAYAFYGGSGLHDLTLLQFGFDLPQNIVTEQLTSRLAPTCLPARLRADGTMETLPIGPCNDFNASIIPKMTPGSEEGIAPSVRGYAQRYCTYDYEPGIHPLIEVAEGKITLDAFMAQLSDDDLIHLLGGQPNRTVANTYGIGNLPEYGIPNLMTADGPAGVRLKECCGVATTGWPCSTMMASTWNTALAEQVGIAGGEELKENNLAIWLTPAVNIHRNPCCGRNFEYYSEDPLLAGTMAAAFVRGVQSNHVAVSVKHFALNNKETNRKHSDSRVSERALREIYLKAFEIIVKTSDPWTVMSSYNAINGYRASESHELLEDILRDEWGFGGLVMTDWWNRSEQYKEILAGNDVKMATGFNDRVRQCLDLGALTRADLEHCARRVLELILKFD